MLFILSVNDNTIHIINGIKKNTSIPETDGKENINPVQFLPVPSKKFHHSGPRQTKSFFLQYPLAVIQELPMFSISPKFQGQIERTQAENLVTI